MVRYTGTLHKLVESACSGKQTTWTQVMNYVESRTMADATAENPPHDSPLAPFTSPSEELRSELVDRQGPKRDETILRTAIKAAPAHVIGALCHLAPETAFLADSRNRLPLHWACRRSSADKETDKLLKILVACNPCGLVHRDDGGRTPLHWLFWYHASSRNSKVVELFCQTLPRDAFAGMKQHTSGNSTEFPLPEIPHPSDKTPCNVCVVPDAKHGALPLHYAVMGGADVEVLRLLVKAYPRSKTMCDRKGFTALAWYLGAGSICERSSHISGEPNDPNATPWWDTKLSNAVVQLLLNSRVARTTDSLGRFPLHWACHLLARNYHSGSNPGQCLSIKAVRYFLDHHIEALTTHDNNGKTPLHLLFDVVAEQQEIEWKRIMANSILREDLNLVAGGKPTPFSPPRELVEMLLKAPDFGHEPSIAARTKTLEERTTSAAYNEDLSGRLPLHAAMKIATVPEVVKVLIQANPASLIHTTEDLLQTPLHTALTSPFSAPLQMVETIDLVLQAYLASRHGTYVDGRLALKMEDAAGKYPIHYACENQACLDVVRVLLEKFPRAALFQNADNELPIHSLLDINLFSPPESGVPIGATLSAPMGWMSEQESEFRRRQLAVNQEKIELMVDLILSADDDVQLLKLTSVHGMLPLAIATAFDAVSYAKLHRMLDLYPDSAFHLTSAEGNYFAPIDLHEMQAEKDDEEQWQAVRELLFSFAPTLETHRRREELLESCVRLIRDEVQGLGSWHLSEAVDAKSKRIEPIADLTETLSCIEVPTIDLGSRPKTGTQHRTPSPIKKSASSKPKQSPPPAAPLEAKNSKSIYDDDGTSGLGYIISPDNTYEDDDSDFFSDERTEEEYFSDDFDSRCDGSFDDDSLKSDRRKPLPQKAPANEISAQDGKSEEEKKEDQKMPSTVDIPEEGQTAQDETIETPFMSEVAMRLWTFFMLYCDPKAPGDNYAEYVDAILDELEFPIVERMVTLPLPSYACHYFEREFDFEGLTLCDVANPKCKEIIHKAYHFLGRLDFRSETGGILIHRSKDDNTVLIRATDYIIDTETYQEPPAETPGVVEAEIWATGSMPPEEIGYMRSTFRMKSRVVCVKFLRDFDQYQNEVQRRRDAGVVAETEGGSFSNTHIIPLYEHYSSKGDRKVDRRYRADTHDPRFEVLPLHGDDEDEYGRDSICLGNYPYALIMPLCGDGDLLHHFLHHGIGGAKEIGELGAQIGVGLRAMHEKGVVHTNLSIGHVVSMPLFEEHVAGKRHWALVDLSFSCRLDSNSSYLGGVSSSGLAQFSSGSLPPEMFVKLSPGELRMYDAYWKAVEKEFNVTVGASILEPLIDEKTGEVYVTRCHYAPYEQDEGDTCLPCLPYKLVPARESADIWALGTLLFSLCSSGRSLFPANMTSSHLLSFEGVANWDRDKAEAAVYENIDDALAQDILLQLLSSYEERASLSIETVLGHPFFTFQDTLSNNVLRLVQERSRKRAAHMRSRQKHAAVLSEEEWLKRRTTEVHCWNLDLQARFHMSASELIRGMVDDDKKPLPMPYGLILLPYKVTRNKSGKLTPAKKKDVEYAERMGVLFLSLSKACQFALHSKRLITESGTSRTWSSSELLESMQLSKEDFGDIESEFIETAAQHVERFRDDPNYITKKMIQRRINLLRDCFEDSKTIFLYLVDEFGGVPVVGGAPDFSYPYKVPEKSMDEVFRIGLPFMHMCSLFVRGASGSIAGLVKLIFEGAYPHIPPSWSAAGKGLTHVLDATSFAAEVNVLREVLASSSSNERYNSSQAAHDDIVFMHDYLLDIDVGRSFCNLRRVTSSGYSLWTTEEGAKEIVGKAQSNGFPEALKAKLLTDKKLCDQEARIAELESKLEMLEFRKTDNYYKQK